jgi:hypothetical protein
MSWIEQANLRVERKMREQQDLLDALKRELPITEEFVGKFLKQRAEPLNKIVAELELEGFQVVSTEPRFFYDIHISDQSDEKVRQYSLTQEEASVTEYYVDNYHTIFGAQWEIKYLDQKTIGFIHAYPKKSQDTHVGFLEYVFYSPVSWAKIKTFTDVTNPDQNLRESIAQCIDTHLERIKTNPKP